MYPGRDAPDLGVFVAGLERQLVALGHQLERAVIDHRGGSAVKYGRLGADALKTARRFQPDVVYAHFLAPAGAVAALVSVAVGAPLVITAHGRDVRNIGSIPGVAQATRLACRRAAVVVAVSDYLRRELVTKLPELDGKIEVVDCGVDLTRFRGRDAGAARRSLDWEGDGPFYLFVGTLDERKNPVRLARAFQQLGLGRLAFVGDGPLRPALADIPRTRLVGRIPHARVADWMAACDVLCQPSTVEPFGQALLEAMASERSVVATSVGGPPEFVTPEAGVLVDPESIESIAGGLEAAAELPRPNLAARRASSEHDVRLQARKVASLLEGAVKAARR
jgi:glycosyltransferase involved in cell wall biosynthesis